MASNINTRPIYWECNIDGHNKFWAAQIIVGHKPDKTTYYTIIRKWGAIGTAGQRVEQTFQDIYSAEKLLQDLIWEKERKGYKAIF